jgi:hypothetical protein
LSNGTYTIADEPRPGALSHLVVNPLWPLLCFMLGGTWMGWSWFVFNGVALGSATRRRELGLVVVGLIGAFVVLIIGSIALKATDSQNQTAARLVLLAATVWKITVSYVLYVWQYRSFSIYEYYGGTVRNGLIIVILGLFVGHRVIDVFGQNLISMVLI